MEVLRGYVLHGIGKKVTVSITRRRDGGSSKVVRIPGVLDNDSKDRAVPYRFKGDHGIRQFVVRQKTLLRRLLNDFNNPTFLFASFFDAPSK